MIHKGLFSLAISCYVSVVTAHMDPLPALHSWSHHCQEKHAYVTACKAYRSHPPKTTAEGMAFLQHYWKLSNPTETLVTGYYTPLYRASYEYSPTLNAPIYMPPPKNSKACSRETINHHHCKQLGPILAWVNQVDRFFLQVQGSALLKLPNGSIKQVAYAGKNGLPYKSVARWLVDTHRLSMPVSMQSIRDYLMTHPKEIDETLNHDPAFVYMRWQSPVRITGSSGKTLTPWHSIAVDSKQYPYGSLIELPAIDKKHGELLTVAEDTGSAIGKNHIDLYLGRGKQAETIAGHLAKHTTTRLWVPR